MSYADFESDRGNLEILGWYKNFLQCRCLGFPKRYAFLDGVSEVANPRAVAKFGNFTKLIKEIFHFL